MKAEKIQKHMLRRTVVVGATNGAVKGVINSADGSAAPVFVAGVSRLSALHGGLYGGWFPPEGIRKATDAERAEFFAWLVSDGRDIADGFSRFGGTPRGFEAWRAAQDAPVEPPAEEAADSAVAPHKVGDLRVGLDFDGTAIVGRVRQIGLDGDIWIGGACCSPDARPLFEPLPAFVKGLAAQQRERGIKPELGDLVFVLHGDIASTAVVADNLSDMQTSLRLQGATCGGGALSWGLSPGLDAHTLVIRRCPFREVADE